MVTVNVDYALERVRITYTEQHELTLEELRSRVEGLENLMMLLVEPDYIANDLVFDSSRDSHGPVPIDELQKWAGEKTIIERVHYNPVLEIILITSAGQRHCWHYGSSILGLGSVPRRRTSNKTRRNLATPAPRPPFKGRN
jgi:hypothetical protein